VVLAGIDKVEFQDDMRITAIISPEGEKVPTKNIIDPKNKNVEAWLLEVRSGHLISMPHQDI
jgi:dynein heavy chain, axonemal